MPTINGTAILADGSALALASVVMSPIEHPAWMLDGTMVSRSQVSTRTGADGVWTITLNPGAYRVQIEPLDTFTIVVPADPEVDEYDVAEVVSTPDGVTLAGVLKTKWFDSVGEMLAADSRIYPGCTLRNSYSNDGIITTWVRVLKVSEESTGLTHNGDSVLEANDGHAFWVRIGIAS